MKDRGFTLLEVLVAMTILSVAVTGLIGAMTQSAKSYSRVNQKFLAGIVADNQLVLARNSPLVLGTQSGEQTQLQILFPYDIVTTSTDVENFYRVIVSVRDADDTQTLVQRTAFREGT